MAHTLIGILVWVVVLGFAYGIWQLRRQERSDAAQRAKAITCPHCHTLGTVAPHTGVQTYTTTRGPLSLSVRSTTRRIVKQLHCSHCGTTWTP